MAPDKRNDEPDSVMRQRLVNSLSQSFPGSALSKALKLMDPDDPAEFEEEHDSLSSSCFAEIRLEKVPMDDEELTSLSWLQDTDLLKNISVDESCDSTDGEIQKENGEIKVEGGCVNYQAHPTHVPYNPLKHIKSKPPYSFSCLIFMAVEDSPDKKLPVKDIYSWILTHFPYFRNAPTGWKNSVRHNLSLNKCFKKVEKEKGQSIGKGSLWCIDPEYRPNLLQALRKTPYHPYHQLQMLANHTPNQPNEGSYKPLPLQQQRVNLNTPSPHLFPFLSKRLAQSNTDMALDIDVANALMSLKGNVPFNPENPRLRPLTPRNGNNFNYGYYKKRYNPYTNLKRSDSPVIFTTIPSDDHTYSASALPKEFRHRIKDEPHSPESSIDEEYDFGHNNNDYDSSSDRSYQSDASDYDESDAESVEAPPRTVIIRHPDRLHLPVKKRYTSCIDVEEERRIVEGADALLNLAGIKTSNVPLRSISPFNKFKRLQTAS